MPLPVFDTETDVPEAFRPEYAQSADGKWRAKTEAELDLERGKKQTLLDEKKEEERKRREAETGRQEAERLLAAKNAGVPESELQRLRDEDAAKRQADLEPVIADRDQWKARAVKAELDDRVKLLAIEHGVMKDRIKLAMRELKERVELGDAGGLVWKDADGKVTTMDDKQFFEQFEKEFELFFEFKGGSGGGTGGSTRGRITPLSAPDDSKATKRESVSSAF